ncbi:MAG: hypothetical protein V4663_15455 [Bacteroidota bacterium]
MKKLIVLLLFFVSSMAWAQNYNNIVNYASLSLPTHGVKIKTNLPFIPGMTMPTITITGFSYGISEPISLTLAFYVYTTGVDPGNPANYYFYTSKISSSAAYTPKIYLSNEASKVVIYIDDRVYAQRFTISAFSMGFSEVNAWFQGWTVLDEVLTGTKTIEVPYQNGFKGDVFLSGNGVWNSIGNVGIGTLTPTEKLSVNGNIRAKEIKVETSGWPDYVFNKDYHITPLKELEEYIKINKHLPEIPSAKVAEQEGINLGEMNKLLLKKIEELTIHLIEKNKAIENQELRIQKMETVLGLKK